MGEEDTLDFRFIAAPEVIEDLREELAKHAEGVEITGSGPVTDATDLSFDLGQVNDLITVINAAFLAGGTLITVLRSVFQKRPEPVRIALESPLGKLTLELHRDMSEEEIRVALRKLTEL